MLSATWLPAMRATVVRITSRRRYSEHFDGPGVEFTRQAYKLGLEGIIAKRRDRPYREGNGFDSR